ncbi:DegT/DnrJ/EryC1/StrS family aminotransferase [Actinoplanes sp. TBRC 11911]|uniref:DegT/DnrJ/EryC1/StrS family aminotransferase n=1 Tax=Actinoplanes sp. TBRC 11911 TaxID=2729386 RepID=UPI00145FAC21|nr:DegT/DnrJ/EryC1/StrS family aminotransferase [Actinoplanes sp. TBRC 11911]NMO50697.1 DegT/DnrJ/EryC1/StrS family aminotransferase [Actinoplanes sp. TBRC 11911]
MTPIAVAAPTLDDTEIAAAVRVLRSGALVQGSEVAAFEDEFSAHVDGRHCIAVSSGTTALWLSLLGLGIGPGDEVIVPSFTFAATAAAVRLTGADCVFADIDPHTYCLDPATAAAAITARTAAIIPVHLYGQPADMDRLTALTARHRLALIEDAAQAHSAAYHERPVGTIGTAAAFSFYPTKNMTAVEGGMITTADPALAHRLRMLRNVGMATRYRYDIVGTNGRLSDVFAAIGRAQLRRLPQFTRIRQGHAARLTSCLSGLPGITTPCEQAGVRHVFHQYTVRVHDGLRDMLAQQLQRDGIETAVHYPNPLHRSPAYRTAIHLPHTDTAANQVLSLPVHPALRDDDLDRIASSVTRHARPRQLAA